MSNHEGMCANKISGWLQEHVLRRAPACGVMLCGFHLEILNILVWHLCFVGDVQWNPGVRARGSQALPVVGFVFLACLINFCCKLDLLYWVKGTEGNRPLVWGFMFIWPGVGLCLLFAVAVGVGS